MSQLLGNLLVFGHLLRSAGVDVHLGRLMDVATALQHADITSRDQVRHTCRALLIHRHEQFPTFERAFDAFWQRHEVGRVAADPARVPLAAQPGGGGRVRYWRLHGSPQVYYDAYGEARLQPWADAVRAEREAGLDCWVILDNTALGHAVTDAMRLETMLGVDAPR